MDDGVRSERARDCAQQITPPAFNEPFLSLSLSLSLSLRERLYYFKFGRSKRMKRSLVKFTWTATDRIIENLESTTSITTRYVCNREH